MSRQDETMNADDLKKLMDADPAFEARLAKALEVEVPELVMPELPPLDGDNVVSLGERTPRRGLSKLTWFAMAATVAIAAFVGFRIDNGEAPGPSLEQQVIAHLDVEPHSLVVSDVPVSDAQLTSVVPANIATMNHDAGLITYAMTCEINGRDVPHLVVQGEKGPVTIMLMPHEAVEEARPLEGESIRGVILPVGDGSIAIIGEKEESLDRIQQNVLESVTWST